MTHSEHSNSPSGALVPRWGAVHIHTDYSDGGISLADTVAAARAAGLDFIQITDHNTLGAREHEGNRDGVFVLVDVEISPTPLHNHVIAVGLDASARLPRTWRADRLIERVEALGAFAWVPHPTGFANPWLGMWNRSWRHWDARIRGLEIGAFLVDWVEQLRPWNLLRSLRDPIAAVSAVDRDGIADGIALWDRVNRSRPGRPIAGFLGLDAHYRRKLGGRLRSPSYELLFGTHNLLVWTPPPCGDAARDAEELRLALRDGRFVNVLAHVGGRRSISFREVERGLAIEIADDREISVRVVRDGETVLESRGADVRLEDPAPGVYRAEISLGNRLWALTNPLRIPAGRSAARAGRERTALARSNHPR